MVPYGCCPRVSSGGKFGSKLDFSVQGPASRGSRRPFNHFFTSRNVTLSHPLSFGLSEDVLFDVYPYLFSFRRMSVSPFHATGRVTEILLFAFCFLVVVGRRRKGRSVERDRDYPKSVSTKGLPSWSVLPTSSGVSKITRVDSGGSESCTRTASMCVGVELVTRR